MALLIAPNPPYPFFTTSNLAVPSAYVRIVRLDYRAYGEHLDTNVPWCRLTLFYYQSEAAAREIPRLKELELRGLPQSVDVLDPLGLLASPDANAYAIAYQKATEALREALGFGAQIANV